MCVGAPIDVMCSHAHIRAGVRLCQLGVIANQRRISSAN